MKNIFKCILTILTANPCNMLHKYYCPYCTYRTDSYEDIRDHLTYYHWMSVPGVDQIIKKLEKKNMACGEPVGCHFTKGKFAAKLMKGMAVVLIVIVAIYYAWMLM